MFPFIMYTYRTSNIHTFSDKHLKNFVFGVLCGWLSGGSVYNFRKYKSKIRGADSISFPAEFVISTILQRKRIEKKKKNKRKSKIKAA